MEENSQTLLEEEFEMPSRPLETLKRMWNSVEEQHGRLLVVFVSVIFYTFLSILAPVYSAGIIDLLWVKIQEAAGGGQAFSVTWGSGGKEICILLAIYGAASLFYGLQNFLMASFAERLSLKLRTDISRKLDRLPLSYFDGHQPGEIMSRTVNDLDKNAEALQTGLLKLFSAVGLVVGSLIMMFRFHGGLTMIFLVFMAFSLLSTRLFSAKTLEFAARRQQCVSQVTRQVEEAYSGRNIIKAFTQEENSSRDMHRVNEELAQASKWADFVTNAINPAIRLINRMGQVGIAVFAGKLLLDGTLSVGRFQAFFQYVYQAGEPLTEGAYMINTMQSALACAERVYQLLDEEEISPEPEIPEVVEKARGLVEFDKVRFGYSPEKILMESISFQATPGQKIAVVGSTGAGKTTLINLLMRFYEVNGGCILLDGVDTRNLTRGNLRENFGMVLQDTWLFQGTIAENIAYGKPEATKEEIIAAAKAARVDFFVRTLPKGYDTVLQNEAENISVGQRQLLTIARVFLCDPPILILDEATSSVDTRTEMEIGKAMHGLMKNRTSFVIAHRLSTIVDADMILFMENGNIIEQGRHRELLEKGGAYAQLYNSQFA